MALHKLFDDSDSSGVILIEGPVIRITRPLALESPTAAAFLAGIPDGHRVSAFDELLEYGAKAAAAAQTSASIVLLEAKVEELTERFRVALADQLKTAGTVSGEAMEKLLQAHRDALTKLLNPLMDPNNKDGLPVRMTEMLDRVNRDAARRIQVMLEDGDEGALAKVVKTIVKEVKETGLAVTKELGAREALLRKSNLRGGRFEDVVASRLPSLVRALGRVEHCATVSGERAGNAGDYIITVTHGAGETVTIALEAKARKNRLSPNAIRAELKLARENRGAAAGILVADSREMLPDGLAFGQVSECDYFVAFDPEEGDDTALTCAIVAAKVAALSSLVQVGDEGIDLVAAQREITLIRGRLDLFSKLETHHVKADREVSSARSVAADIKAEIMAALRRLDSLLQ